MNGIKDNMDFDQYITTKKIEARKRNLQEVRDDIDKAWVKEKIQQYIQRWDGMFTYEELREKILTDDFTASVFCKDPSKQNISEKLAAEVLGVPKLPTQGKNCIRFSPEGKIVWQTNGGENTKSADFYLNESYVTQKYTDQTGGAQDNQRNDVIQFLQYGSINYKVMGILDGPYWTQHREELKQMFKNNPNVQITSITELTSS